MQYVDKNFDAKFGTPPASVTLPAQTVLIGQLVFVVSLLVVTKPPFVMDSTEVLDPLRVLTVALAATLLTWVLSSSGMSPSQTVQNALHMAHMMARG